MKRRVCSLSRGRKQVNHVAVAIRYALCTCRSLVTRINWNARTAALKMDDLMSFLLE
jgi:hypothetical protein